jgi:hypothetical protein
MLELTIKSQILPFDLPQLLWIEAPHTHPFPVHTTIKEKFKKGLFTPVTVTKLAPYPHVYYSGK